MRPATLLRLAVTGRSTDRVRIVLTAIASAGATLACLCAATVAAIQGNGAAIGKDTTAYYSSLLTLPGLRTGVEVALLIVTVPFLALAVQCARLGSPARDRRIAAIRLAGATPGQARAIGAGETGAAALFGAACGLVVFLVGRVLIDDPDAAGVRQLPTDVLPSAGIIVAICVGLPVLGALLAGLLLRGVITSPLGVVRRVRPRRPPRIWPAVLILIGIAVALLIRYSYLFFSSETRFTYLKFALFGGLICAATGVVLSVGWISHVVGRLLRRLSGHAAGQIAAARLIADPWAFSRTLGVLLVASLVGGVTAGLYAADSAEMRLEALSDGAEALSHDTTFYIHTYELVGLGIAIGVVISACTMAVALVETITSRRRAYAALVATGVPRGVLGRASLWQMMTVALPSVILSVGLGDLLVRTVESNSISVASDSDGSRITVLVGIPWGPMVILVAVALLAIAAMVGVSLRFLKASTDVEELRTT